MPKRTFPAEILEPSEIKRLLQQCSKRCPTGIRNRALIVTLWRAGLRCAEALSLHEKDINPRLGSVRVLRGKGAKSRTVGMDEYGWAVLDLWMQERRRLGLNGNQPVFCTLKGGSLWDGYVRNLFKRLARKAGIEKRVHPHGLRHTHAYELLSEGVRVDVISKQLGHRSIATTVEYLDHIAPQEVLESVRNRPAPVLDL